MPGNPQATSALQRARQAATVPTLDGASAEQGFFAVDGTVIHATAAFASDDPIAAKQVTALPFYKTLPK